TSAWPTIRTTTNPPTPSSTSSRPSTSAWWKARSTWLRRSTAPKRRSCKSASSPRFTRHGVELVDVRGRGRAAGWRERLLRDAQPVGGHRLRHRLPHAQPSPARDGEAAGRDFARSRLRLWPGRAGLAVLGPARLVAAGLLASSTAA